MCTSEDFAWDRVVPRIVNPTKIKIIELLIAERRPLSATRMDRLLTDPEVTVGQLHYHCETLRKAGVLDQVGTDSRGAANERFYCLAAEITTA